MKLKKSALALVLTSVFLLSACGNGGEIMSKNSDSEGLPGFEEENSVPDNSYGLNLGNYSVQSYEFKNIDGSVTTFQCSAEYNDTLNLNSDSVMVYVRNKQDIDKAFPSWIETGKYEIDMMVALNRDHSDWVKGDSKNISDVQARRDGTLYRHGGLTDSYDFYMVPTKGWTEYLWELIEPCISKYNPGMIALEEPEMWHDAGYSEAFKKEWQDYYGSEWVDPLTSPEATYKAEILKKYLIERIIEDISGRIKEKSPETKVYLATHSTLSYNACSVMTGLNSYISLGVLDGIIGQTWSDTVYLPVKYQGNTVNEPFSNAFLEYASYTDSVRDMDFYALTDPKADAPNYTWDTYEYLYRHTVTAALLQPEIQKFELFPWPDRSFTPAPAQYKAYQLNVFNALEDISGKAAEIYAGTAGVGFLLSDTVSWQCGNSGWGNNTAESIYGMTMPLVKKGIPVKFKALELIKSKQDLADLKVLFVSYDSMKPLSIEYNKAIAEWVKDGGVLVYIGGYDKYENIEGSWWLENGGTPANNLLDELGLGEISLEPFPGAGSEIVWCGSADYSETAKNYSYSNSFMGKFTGKSVEEAAILKSGDEIVGIEKRVGNGSFIGLSIPSAYFSTSESSAQMMRDILKYSLGNTDTEYIESNMMLTKRGRYVSAYAFDKKEVLGGKFIDIYDNELSVLSSVEVAPDSSVLLYDISDIEINNPAVIYSGGEIEIIDEGPDKTSYKISGPLGSPVSQRILAKEGVYPATVSAKIGDKEVPVYSRWDNKTSSLLVQALGSVEPTSVDITWGSEKTEDGAEIKFNDISVEANSRNLDSEFLYKNGGAEAHEYYRYCDKASYLIYKVDLNKYKDAVVTIDIFQNYVVEISGDGENFTETHNYSKINSKHITNANNRTVVCLPSYMYDGITDSLYIRISNSNKEMGWGGSVSKFSVMYSEN